MNNATRVRLAKMEPLGVQRLRVLDCIGGNDVRGANRFESEAGADVFDAFRRFVAATAPLWEDETDPMHVSTMAAAHLLLGDIASGDVIVDLLPERPYKLDHGAGRCLVAAVYALKNTLPLPAELKDTDRWTAGSPEQAALRGWLAAHRDRLLWREAEGDYVLAGQLGGMV